MKTVWVFILFCISSSLSVLAQTEKLQSGDSIRIELERKVLGLELKQLHDSINQSLKVFDVFIKKSSGSKKEKLVENRRILVTYRDRVKLDLDEVSITARNAWGNDSVKRIRANMITARYEYKRISAKALNG